MRWRSLSCSAFCGKWSVHSCLSSCSYSTRYGPVLDLLGLWSQTQARSQRSCPSFHRCWEPGCCQVSGRDKSEPKCLGSQWDINSLEYSVGSWLELGCSRQGIHGLQRPAHSGNSVTDTNICTLQTRALARWSHVNFFCPPAFRSFACAVKHTQMLSISLLADNTVYHRVFLMPVHLLIMCLGVFC